MFQTLPPLTPIPSIHVHVCAADALVLNFSLSFSALALAGPLTLRMRLVCGESSPVPRLFPYSRYSSALLQAPPTGGLPLTAVCHATQVCLSCSCHEFVACTHIPRWPVCKAGLGFFLQLIVWDPPTPNTPQKRAVGGMQGQHSGCPRA